MKKNKSNPAAPAAPTPAKPVSSASNPPCYCRAVAELAKELEKKTLWLSEKAKEQPLSGGVAAHLERAAALLRQASAMAFLEAPIRPSPAPKGKARK